MSANELPPFNRDVQTKHTASPNPSFAFGQKVEATEDGRKWVEEGDKAGWKVFDTAAEDPRKMYALMISGIVPRPIAFVSTISADGTENLAPFSWFNQVSHSPPLISISCSSLPNGGLKDTPRNIKETKGFTVNIIGEPFIENANITSIDTPPDVSEWTLSGLTREPSLHVKPARVKESAFSMECELFHAVDIIHPDNGRHTATMIIGHVKYIHVRRDVLTERDTVDVSKFRAVGRLGDISYGRIGDAFRLPRANWAEECERGEIQTVLQGDEKSAAKM